jgi:hypothetical protein
MVKTVYKISWLHWRVLNTYDFMKLNAFPTYMYYKVFFLITKRYELTFIELLRVTILIFNLKHLKWYFISY